MQTDDQLAQWAALFLDKYGAEADAEPPVLSPTAVPYSGITPAACALLQSVDAGGVPAFVTHSLKQIALENGVAVTELSTPNQIVDAIRGKATLGR